MYFRKREFFFFFQAEDGIRDADVTGVQTCALPISPPPPPMPSVVEYPTGRYELRGDGAMTPYTWIWIPNPPPAPPSAPPMDPAAPVGSPGVRLSKLYHWTDDEGVAHWTDRRDVVP